MKRILFFCMSMCVLAGCKGGRPAAELKIEIPEPPAILTNKPRDQITEQDALAVARFMAEHYWDKMPFADTAYIDKEVTLQAFSNYAFMLLNWPRDLVRESVNGTMERAKVDTAMYFYFAKMAGDHFYDNPNSPYRNDDIYALFAENIVAWDGAGELDKIRPREQLAMIARNRVGSPADDFLITWADGKASRLYDIRAPHTLVIFISPDCPICASLIEDLAGSAFLGRLVDTGRLRVVTLYPEGDVDLWRKHLPDLPVQWLHGYSPGLLAANLYDLRARPSLYLLDAAKNVLLKDSSSAAQVEEMLAGD